jgi:hypothetical protein
MWVIFEAIALGIPCLLDEDMGLFKICISLAWITNYGVREKAISFLAACNFWMISRYFSVMRLCPIVLRILSKLN